MKPIVFVLAMTVATPDGVPVQAPAWVEAQLAEANRVFAASGVSFVRDAARAHATLDAPAQVVTRADRDAIGAALYRDGSARGAIPVALVASLADVDEEGRVRMGVCWRSLRAPEQRYVILSAAAKPGVLAHELGHYFGNGHSKVADNVMSYERHPGVPAFFDAGQLGIIRRTADGYVGSGLLVTGH